MEGGRVGKGVREVNKRHVIRLVITMVSWDLILLVDTGNSGMYLYTTPHSVIQ